MRESKEQAGDTADLIETPVNEQECMVLAALRKLEYGEIRVLIQDSSIVFIEEKKTIKLK